jgi:hypothetical protein
MPASWWRCAAGRATARAAAATQQAAERDAARMPQPHPQLLQQHSCHCVGSSSSAQPGCGALQLALDCCTHTALLAHSLDSWETGEHLADVLRMSALLAPCLAAAGQRERDRDRGPGGQALHARSRAVGRAQQGAPQAVRGHSRVRASGIERQLAGAAPARVRRRPHTAPPPTPRAPTA